MNNTGALTNKWLHKVIFLSARIPFGAVDQQNTPDPRKLLCCDHEVAGKFRLISVKRQAKLDETQHSGSWMLFKAEMTVIVFSLC